MKLLMSLLNRVFTTVDLKSAYYQIELHPLDREFTVFQSGDAYRLVLAMLSPNSNEQLITLSERTT